MFHATPTFVTYANTVTYFVYHVQGLFTNAYLLLLLLLKFLNKKIEQNCHPYNKKQMASGQGSKLSRVQRLFIYMQSTVKFVNVSTLLTINTD